MFTRHRIIHRVRQTWRVIHHGGPRVGYAESNADKRWSSRYDRVGRWRLQWQRGGLHVNVIRINCVSRAAEGEIWKRESEDHFIVLDGEWTPRHHSDTIRDLTVKNVMHEWFDCEKSVEKMRMSIITDSGATEGTLHQKCRDRVRLLATRYLWHQETLRDRLRKITRVNLKDNVVDFDTKILDLKEMNNCIIRLHLKLRSVVGFIRVDNVQRM